ncbi:hypothetical protein [Spirosoma sordidisoli]|uniref:Uncharacterized protein n=1 Tax=Spirosoma sordidisoli TaxID=2502893 RepID=A0A4V1RVJ2_9BACT|nr:hypothetical protein [Spirosoma sordidisoli]RYC66958.1 hypothetical protein EQG79_26650 [Spirosoma sordidisoli]
MKNMLASYIYKLLCTKSFELVNHNTSKFFDDYFEIFTNGSVDIRFSSSKSYSTIDVRIASEEAKWYDLALIIAYLLSEKDLSKAKKSEEYFEFFNCYFDQIIELFNEINYSITQEKLDELGSERARQLFPGIISQ